MKNSFLANLQSAYLINGLALVFSLMNGFLIARFLGPENKGIFAIYQASYSLIIQFSTLGVRQACVLLINESVFTKNMIDSLLTKLFFKVSIFAIILFNLLIYFTLTPNAVLSFVFTVIIPLTIFTSFGSYQLLVNKHLNPLHISKAILGASQSLLLVLIFFLIEMTLEMAGYLFLVGCVSSVFYLLRHVSFLTFNSAIKFFPMIKKLFSKSLKFFFASLILTLNYKVDLFILAKYVNFHDIGLYSITVAIFELVWQIPIMVAPVVFAFSRELELKKLIIIASFILIMVMTFPIVYLYDDVIKLILMIVGAEYAGIESFALILFLGIVTLIPVHFISANIGAYGVFKPTIVVFGVSLILNVLLNEILIPTYGVYGAALASLISYGSASFFFVCYYILSFKSKLSI